MADLTWQVLTNTPFSLHDPANGYTLLDYDGAGNDYAFDLADKSEMLSGDIVNARTLASTNRVLRLRVEGNSLSQFVTRQAALQSELNKPNLSIAFNCDGVLLETWYGCWLSSWKPVGLGSNGKSGPSKFGFMNARKKQDYEFNFMSVVPA